MWFVLLSSALAQDVQSQLLDGGAEFTLAFEDGETVTARFHGGVFATRDAELAMARLGDHLFENMDVFGTGGGASSVDIDLGGGTDLVDELAGDLLGMDVEGGACASTTSVGDVLVSFAVDLGLGGEEGPGEAPDGVRADTGGLADGDAGSAEDRDMESTMGSEDHASGTPVSFVDRPTEEATGVDAVYNQVMDGLFGSSSGGEPTSLESHELAHIVQQQRGTHRDTGWEGTWEGGLDGEICLPSIAAEANINWNILGVSMVVQPDPTRSDEEIVEGEDIAPIDLIGEALRFEATEAYLRDDSRWDTDPSPRGE